MLYLRTLAIITLSLTSITATAGLRELGHDYRSLRSNYSMLDAIKRRCPSLPKPQVVYRGEVHDLLKEKVGEETFTQLFADIARSDLKANAYRTIDKLFEQIEGCEDPKLAQVVTKIEQVHAETFTHFEQQPALVAPTAVPVPLRRD